MKIAFLLSNWTRTRLLFNFDH